MDLLLFAYGSAPSKSDNPIGRKLNRRSRSILRLTTSSCPRWVRWAGIQDCMVAEEKICMVISVLLEIDLVRIIAFAERADSIEERTSSL